MDFEVREASLRTNQDLKELMKELGGGVLCRNCGKRLRRTIEELDDKGVYVIVGGTYGTMMTKRARQQVEDKVLELEAALAVQKYLKKQHKIDSHIHQNVKFTESGQDKLEIDAIVMHTSCEDAGSSAYLIECALSPQVHDIEKLHTKVGRFKTYANTLPLFSSVDKVIPVLAGRNWSRETIDECNASNTTLWRVSPSGESLQVHNNLLSAEYEDSEFSNQM